MDRKPNGQFATGNKISRRGGLARARALTPQRRREIAESGLTALANKYFQGDRKRALDWLIARGLFEQDKGQHQRGLGLFPDPGPLPEPTKESEPS